jgi:hypothetical protein
MKYDLKTLYDFTSLSEQGRQPAVKTDILRAAVDLLHASLENFLRSLMIVKVSIYKRRDLGNYPLHGKSARSDRKFSSGVLAHYPELSVGKLIQRSVFDNLLALGSYGNLGEVKQALVSFGADRDTVEQHDYGTFIEMF